MVASGLGLTVLPQSSVPVHPPRDSLISYVPFEDPVPTRRIVLAWRKSYVREAAISTLAAAIRQCEMNGVTPLTAAVTAT